MMTESDLVTAKLLCRVMECPAPHFRTKRAGILFLSDVENYLRNFGIHHVVFDIKRLAKVAYRRKIHALKAHTYGYRTDLIFFWIEASHRGESTQKSERILTCGYTDSDPVAVLNHVVVVARTADVA